MKEELIWHYTSFVHLTRIIQCELLKVSNADLKAGVKPAIWFTRNAYWERTATKSVRNRGVIYELTEQQQLETIGKARIAIEFSDKLISFKKYKKLGVEPVAVCNQLAKIGLRLGANPQDWYCTFENIPSVNWVDVEVFHDDVWKSIHDHEHVYRQLFEKYRDGI